MKDLTQGELELTFPSHTSFVHMVITMARNAASVAGFDDAVAGKVSIACDEAVTNVIRHAYGGKPGKTITMQIDITEKSLVIRVYHTGKALTKDDIKLPNMDEYIAEKKVGGLGLYIMNKFMDEVDYSVGKENCCQMVKYRK